MDKSILQQKLVRDNSEDLRKYLSELKLWEDEMKRKESELSKGDDEKSQETSNKKHSQTKIMTKKDNKTEIKKVDDEKESDSDNEDALNQQRKLLKEESLKEKEQGNKFVREQRWSEAIACYTHAIACYSKDPVYYANRALCFLKRNDYNNAQIDCTEALKLNPNYVKALQRRAAALAGLNITIDAIKDLKRVMELEPHNTESEKELQRLINTLDPDIQKKVKPAADKKPVVTQSVKVAPVQPTIPWPERKTAVELSAINKPPHLRSKKPLVRIPINDLSTVKHKLESTKKNVAEVEKETTEKREANSSNISSKIDYTSSDALASILAQSKQLDVDELLRDLDENPKSLKSSLVLEPINIKKTDSTASKPKVETFNFPVPKSSVHFYSNWKAMEDNLQEKAKYLAKIKPSDLPGIFQQYLESDALSDIINIMEKYFMADELDVYSYLLGLSQIKRFSAIVMFLSNKDKSALNNLLEYCSKKNISTEKINTLRKVYEL